jgi:hypothetical protein
MARSLLEEFAEYVGEIRRFNEGDWRYYTRWVGLMLGLLVSVSGFLFFGAFQGVGYPGYVWNIPIGIVIFVGAIALDTIGHRTRYRQRLEDGEGFVHSITIALGISSVLALCLAYAHPDFFRIPALVLIAMSIFYSVVDEAMHWRRYMAGQSDRVEMLSHVFIFIGHITMSLAWWHWFIQGYPGVADTLRYL